MLNRKGFLQSEELSKVIVLGMQEKKAEDIQILDLRQVPNAVADFFVVCTGNSDTQIDAISDSVAEFVYKADEQDPWHIEGKTSRDWVLIDYVDVVAHVFKGSTREFFKLEDLWGDAKVTKIAS
jgi:ribosome-associated protein